MQNSVISTLQPKKSRQINYSAISLEERCFHEIFAKKARENFCYFHTVHMHIVEKYKITRSRLLLKNQHFSVKSSFLLKKKLISRNILSLIAFDSTFPYSATISFYKNFVKPTHFVQKITVNYIHEIFGFGLK